mgnify:CR=1 FL=1
MKIRVENYKNKTYKKFELLYILYKQKKLLTCSAHYDKYAQIHGF